MIPKPYFIFKYSFWENVAGSYVFKLYIKVLKGFYIHNLHHPAETCLKTCTEKRKILLIHFSEIDVARKEK